MRPFSVLLAGLLLSGTALAYGSDLDEFKIKRQEVFEFAEKPRLTRSGDRVDLAFESKGYCDVTVAIENTEGKIVRHLASGVLGPNAPEPFQKNSLQQSLVWDGKNERGEYVDEKERCVVRVSLGLQPRLERTLDWDPRKRINRPPCAGGGWMLPPLLEAAPEGVYVFDGMGADQLRLFDHAGNYVRAVYPFPRDKIGEVVGLEGDVFPQDGRKLPRKQGRYECTLLTSGENAFRGSYGLAFRAARAMAVRGNRVVLAGKKLNRLATDGTTGGLPLEGPRAGLEQRYGGGVRRDYLGPVYPSSAALSPDGKTLYLTGYVWDKFENDWAYENECCLHGVYRVDVESNAPPALFAGSGQEEGSGSAPGQFACALSVACDPQGRVYAADYMNNRIQVFSPDGKFLKALPARRPAAIRISPQTGELWVFSWMRSNQFLLAELSRVEGQALKERRDHVAARETLEAIPPTCASFGTFDRPNHHPTLIPLPLSTPARIGGGRGSGCGHHVSVEMDCWADPPVLWVAEPSILWDPSAFGKPEARRGLPPEQSDLRLFAFKNGKLELLRNFTEEARKAVARTEPPVFSRQRLYVDPDTGLLYVAEHLEKHNKYCKELLELDPATGKISLVPLPFDFEDMAIRDGFIFMRSRHDLARYDLKTWREVPFDYGEERNKVGCGLMEPAHCLSVIHGLYVTLWHAGGMHVNPQGDIVVSCYATKGVGIPTIATRLDVNRIGEVKEAQNSERGSYLPAVFPGRFMLGEVHVFNKFGQRIRPDAIPGLAYMEGLAMDSRGDYYVMTSDTRILDGKPYFNLKTGTLVKFKAGKGKVISSSAKGGFGTLLPVPLTDGARPGFPPQVLQTTGNDCHPAWMEGAEWLYGGVGFSSTKAGNCNCSNSRFALDDFARSFVPEVGHHSVAVLDTNGNLMLRVGQYGNVEDGMPLVKDGGPPNPRSVGGDEVSLMYAPYVGTHTDKRLFIADPGNGRILSVKLGYHATESVPLKTGPDRR